MFGVYPSEAQKVFYANAIVLRGVYDKQTLLGVTSKTLAHVGKFKQDRIKERLSVKFVNPYSCLKLHDW